LYNWLVRAWVTCACVIKQAWQPCNVLMLWYWEYMEMSRCRVQ